MSPELETLDQLLGGDMRLSVIAELFESTATFQQGVLGLLECGDVTLIGPNSDAVPDWQWRLIFTNVGSDNLEQLFLRITTRGANRIK